MLHARALPETAAAPSRGGLNKKWTNTNRRVLVKDNNTLQQRPNTTNKRLTFPCRKCKNFFWVVFFYLHPKNVYSNSFYFISTVVVQMTEIRLIMKPKLRPPMAFFRFWDEEKKPKKYRKIICFIWNVVFFFFERVMLCSRSLFRKSCHEYFP